MNKINVVCFLILFFSFSSCFNNEKRNLKKSKSIIYDENINIDKIMIEMQVKSFKDDSLMENYLSKKLKEIGADTIAEIGKDTVFCARFILSKYGDIFKNNHKYLIVYEQSMMRSGYNWYLKTNKGFVKFYERDKDGIEGALYIKDSIFDTNKDGLNELVAYKHRGSSGSDYKIIYFLNKEGLISKEAIEELNEEEFKTLDDY
jgi:hypothetical protein